MRRWEKIALAATAAWGYVMFIPVVAANSPDDWAAALVGAGVAGVVAGLITAVDTERKG